MRPDALAAIADPTNERFISVAAIWEIAIKSASGKLTLPCDAAAWTHEALAQLVANTLDIRLEHTLVAANLPPIHADPFDRLMIAQAQIEGLTFITRDAANRKYPIALLEA